MTPSFSLPAPVIVFELFRNFINCRKLLAMWQFPPLEMQMNFVHWINDYCSVDIDCFCIYFNIPDCLLGGSVTPLWTGRNGLQSTSLASELKKVFDTCSLYLYEEHCICFLLLCHKLPICVGLTVSVGQKSAQRMAGFSAQGLLESRCQPGWLPF